ncbi:MAG: DUF721 domain-containing protein [Bdellovibrionales bacterium]|nr:DUF721 domain-containing protein [Bdellovibrionales bacterium]
MKDPRRPPRKEPSRLGDILGPLLRQRLGSDDLAGEHEIGRLWRSAVGPEIARHARPGSLRKGLLTVEVNQPAWATELQFQSPRILDRINEAAGKLLVSELRFRVIRDFSR